MITPSKVIPYNKSLISKFELILSINKDSISVIELYRLLQKNFDEVDQFMMTLDALFVLGKINVDFKKGTIYYVK